MATMIAGYALKGLGYVLDLGLNFYMILIIGRAVISWVNADPFNPIVRFLVRSTEPVLRGLRRRFPKLANVGGIDITPLVVLALIVFLQTALAEPLVAFGTRMSLGH